MLRKCLLLLVLIVPLYGQIRARVDLVVVPVTVRDNNGNLLTDLSKDDFAILEDGKPQTISNFSIDERPLSAVIVVDNAVRTASLNRIVTRFSAFVAGFKPEDEIALYRYDHSIWKLSEFTSDASHIERTFVSVAQIAAARPEDADPNPSLDTRPGWLRTLGNVFKGAQNGPSGRRTGIPTVDQSIGAGKQTRILHDAMFDAAMLVRSRAPNRRKVIFLITDGKVAEPRKAHTLEQNQTFLLQNQIQVFAVATEAALLEGPFEMLEAYSSATGGDVYGGWTDMDMKFAFERLIEESHKQYVLGYVSNNTPSERPIFRRIVVTSGDASQGRKVTYRQGYTQLP